MGKMKVLLINGSPHKNGCTYTVLSEVGETLEKQEIATQIYQIGVKPVRGCMLPEVEPWQPTHFIR